MSLKSKVTRETTSLLLYWSEDLVLFFVEDKGGGIFVGVLVWFALEITCSFMESGLFLVLTWQIGVCAQSLSD